MWPQNISLVAENDSTVFLYSVFLYIPWKYYILMDVLMFTVLHSHVFIVLQDKKYQNNPHDNSRLMTLHIVRYRPYNTTTIRRPLLEQHCGDTVNRISMNYINMACIE